MRRPVSDWHVLIGIVSVYIALLFNGVEAIRRFSAVQDGAYALIGLELLLVLCMTAALFYLASLAGRAMFKVVVAFVLVSSAVAAYYMDVFNVVIGYGIAAATLTTDMDLSKEVIGAGVITFVLALGVVPVIAVVITRLKEGAVAGRVAMLGVSGLIGFAVAVTYPMMLQQHPARTQTQSANPLGLVAYSYVPSNWLTGLWMFALSAYERPGAHDRLMSPADKFSYRTSTDLDGTYLVIIIGESARYDRMGIFGHSRPNTPEIGRIPNLVAMRANSCNTSTELSLQCMFVRPEAVDDGGASGRQTVSEDMVFSVLKTLGFTSELFAMQGDVWFYDRVNANYYKHRGMIAARNENVGKPIDDLLLVRELQESIARYPQGKHLVVLHTKGSHHLYTYRYPRSFAWYTPECMSVDTSCDRKQLLNSYDNSIAFTDHFLGQVIGTLDDKKAIVIYTSDHGESIGDTEQKIHLHGTPKSMAPPEQFMVPIIIWASMPFLSDPRNAHNFASLRARKDEMADHRDLFDSILGCLGVESDDGGIDPHRNLCAGN